MKKLRRWGVNPRFDKNEYVVPLWLKEVLRELKSENKPKAVIASR